MNGDPPAHAFTDSAIDSLPWWLWPNLWGIDAAAVAVVWQRFLARRFEVPVPAAASIVLAFTVWGIYLADRWLDARKAPPEEWRDRHRYASRHPQLFAVMAVSVLLVALILAFTLPLKLLETGGIFAAFVATYFLIVHFIPAKGGSGLKESSVGLLFGAGISVPLIQVSDSEFLSCLSAVFGFAFLCVANCLLITKWESANGEKPDRPQLMTCALIVLACGFLTTATIAFCLLVALIGLLMLNFFRSQLGPRALRVLADVVLLSPILSAISR